MPSSRLQLTPSFAEARLVAGLEASARADLGIDKIRLALAEGDAFNRLSIEKRKGARLAQTMARHFNTEIVWVTNESPDQFRFSGAQLGEEIYINVDAAAPHQLVFGHELVHRIKNRSPAVYQALEASLEQFLDKSLAHHRSDAYRFVLGLEPGRADAYVKEELIAELVGRRLCEPEVLEEIKRQMMPTDGKSGSLALVEFFELLVKFIKEVEAFLVSLVDHALLSAPVGQAGPYGGDDCNVDQFVTDLKQVRAIVTATLSEVVESFRTPNAMHAEPAAPPAPVAIPSRRKNKP